MCEKYRSLKNKSGREVKVYTKYRRRWEDKFLSKSERQ